MIFFVPGLPYFYGYAKMTSVSRQEESIWASEKGSVKCNLTFDVEWISE